MQEGKSQKNLPIWARNHSLPERDLAQVLSYALQVESLSEDASRVKQTEQIAALCFPGIAPLGLGGGTQSVRDFFDSIDRAVLLDPIELSRKVVEICGIHQQVAAFCGVESRLSPDAITKAVGSFYAEVFTQEASLTTLNQAFARFCHELSQIVATSMMPVYEALDAYPLAKTKIRVVDRFLTRYSKNHPEWEGLIGLAQIGLRVCVGKSSDACEMSVRDLMGVYLKDPLLLDRATIDSDRILRRLNKILRFILRKGVAHVLLSPYVENDTLAASLSEVEPKAAVTSTRRAILHARQNSEPLRDLTFVAPSLPAHDAMIVKTMRSFVNFSPLSAMHGGADSILACGLGDMIESAALSRLESSGVPTKSLYGAKLFDKAVPLAFNSDQKVSKKVERRLANAYRGFLLLVRNNLSHAAIEITPQDSVRLFYGAHFLKLFFDNEPGSSTASPETTALINNGTFREIIQRPNADPHSLLYEVFASLEDEVLKKMGDHQTPINAESLTSYYNQNRARGTTVSPVRLDGLTFVFSGISAMREQLLSSNSYISRAVNHGGFHALLAGTFFADICYSIFLNRGELGVVSHDQGNASLAPIETEYVSPYGEFLTQLHPQISACLGRQLEADLSIHFAFRAYRGVETRVGHIAGKAILAIELTDFANSPATPTETTVTSFEALTSELFRVLCYLRKNRLAHKSPEKEASAVAILEELGFASFVHSCFDVLDESRQTMEEPLRAASNSLRLLTPPVAYYKNHTLDPEKEPLAAVQEVLSFIYDMAIARLSLLGLECVPVERGEVIHLYLRRLCGLPADSNKEIARLYNVLSAMIERYADVILSDRQCANGALLTSALLYRVLYTSSIGSKHTATLGEGDLMDPIGKKQQ
jgi:hypothetical protein